MEQNRVHLHPNWTQRVSLPQNLILLIYPGFKRSNWSSLINNSLSRLVLSIVARCNTSEAAWKSLVRRNAFTSQNQIQQTLGTLHATKDPTKKALLAWTKCFQIIEGIGRGIIYLHRDSRLKVIHRDLKPSNILLDKDLNPKISDFGMARIFGGDELQANTIRVVGTYGYMSPEYAMEGQFSEKSDVYSFGVLLLEIVTGMRNTGFYHHKESLSLIRHVWKLWKEDNTEALVDPTISEPSFKDEILKCIQVGLLCVQDYAKDRPSMSSIISMLTSEITSIPIPNEPAFTGRQVIPGSDSCYVSPNMCSINNVSITTVEGR